MEEIIINWSSIDNSIGGLLSVAPVAVTTALLGLFLGNWKSNYGSFRH